MGCANCSRMSLTFHENEQFDKIVDAHRYLEASGQVGKIVVTV